MNLGLQLDGKSSRQFGNAHYPKTAEKLTSTATTTITCFRNVFRNFLDFTRIKKYGAFKGWVNISAASH